MGKFILIYVGQATDMADMTEEQQKDVGAKWQAWIGKLGDKLVDVGSPFGQGASVVDDGSAGTPNELTGYSVVEAPDLESVKTLCEGHPFLSEGKGNFAIDIFEMLPAPF